MIAVTAMATRIMARYAMQEKRNACTTSVRDGSSSELSTEPKIMAGSVTESTRFESPLSKEVLVRPNFLQP